ncbi:MAG: HRDC domain-containing protein [Acidobacteria bacterium]|nr:HRDC domain-containing protein [Acidobacteriota bacterium]
MNNETETASSPRYTFIATNEEFRNVLERLDSSSRLAIDVEADSLYHYFEKVCLIQISSDSDTYILDPLTIDKIDTLAPMMSDPAVEKVFHAASYDFYCLQRDYGFSFRNVFDTHIAAQLLGYEFLGLSALMEDLLGIHHSKRRQRDDWSRRPLKSEQLEYAAMDTYHLLRLRDTLAMELKQKGRQNWASEEFETAVAVERPPKEFDPEGFRRIKGCRDLSSQEQTVLRALYILRDSIARELDVPPFKAMNNSVMIDLVRKPPRNTKEMFNRSGISYRIARKYSSDILDTIRGARQQDPVPLQPPVRNNWKPLSQETKHRMNALKDWRKSKAKELDLHIGVVFPANLLENLAETPPADLKELQNLSGMRQWRVQEFGEELLGLLHSRE